MGRQKQFERDDVTDKALQVFWRKGYVDASLKDLESATGVFKPALYSEYGDKEGLFLECVRYYREHYSGRLLLLREDRGWKNIEDFLKAVLPRKGEKGCFEALAFARDVPILAEKLQPILHEGAEAILQALMENLKAAQVKPASLEFLANTIFTFYCGLSALANSQARKRLEKNISDFLNHLQAQSG